VNKIEFEGEQPESYPLIVGGIIEIELFLGFIDGECRQYEKYTSITDEGRDFLRQEGIENGQFYYGVIGNYTFDGSTLEYVDISGNYEGDQPLVRMTFDASGTMIFQEGPGLDRGTIYVEKVSASILAGAIQKPLN